MQDRVHHPYSPSQLQSLEACPCYRGRESTHERTTIGTIAHGVAESGQDDNRLDDYDAAAAAECLDFVEQRRQLFLEERGRAIAEIASKLIGENRCDAADKLVGGCIEIKEEYLTIDDAQFKETWISPLDGSKEEVSFKGTTAGYIDHGFISWDRKHAEIYDWKFGFWPVEDAANNLQGLAYILGIFKKYKSLERVTFFFKQPHLDHVSSVTLTRADVPSVFLRIAVVVDKARIARKSGSFEAAIPRVPVCTFCANIGVCPKVASLVLKVASKFYPLEVPENITPTMVIEGKDATLCLRVAQIAGVWAAAIKTQTTNRVISGVIPPPPSYCIQKRQNREIVDPVKFKKTCLGYVTAEQYEQSCTPGFGKLEKVIQDKAPRGQKKHMVEEFGKSLMESGATKLGDPYVFLRAIPEKKKDDTV